jgi:hypothetical protein
MLKLFKRNNPFYLLKPLFSVFVFSIGLFCLSGCSESFDLSETENSEMTASSTSATEEETTEENTIPYYSYSGDRYANDFITYYNYFYDNEITQDMVSYSNEGYIPKTVIHFENLDFTVTEMDGSSSYKCVSTNGIGESEKDQFMGSVKKMIKGIFPSLSDSTIQYNIITELIRKEQDSPDIGGIVKIKIDNSPYSFCFSTKDDYYEVTCYYASY